MTSIEQLVISDPTLYRYGSNMSQYASTQMSSCSYNIDAAKLYSHRFYSRYRLPPPPKQPPLPSVHCVLPSLRRPFPNWDEIDHAPASVGMLALTLGRVFGAKAVEVECSFLLPLPLSAHHYRRPRWRLLSGNASTSRGEDLFHVIAAKSTSLWWCQLTVNVSLGDESIIFAKTASLSFPLYSSGRNCRNPPLPFHGTLRRTSP